MALIFTGSVAEAQGQRTRACGMLVSWSMDLLKIWVSFFVSRGHEVHGQYREPGEPSKILCSTSDYVWFDNKNLPRKMQEFFLSWGWVVLKAPEKTCFGQNIDGLVFQNVVQQVVLGISATLEEVLQSFRRSKIGMTPHGQSLHPCSFQGIEWRDPLSEL